jgi:large subunit ribosomal protein L10
MKTKAQKSEELKKAKVLLDKSQALIFADFTKITAEQVRKLRSELKKSNANFLVIKKRLLGILLKEKGIDADVRQFKVSVGTIFGEGTSDTIAGPAYNFFKSLEVPEGGDKAMWVKKLLGGYDIASSTLMDAAQVAAIGKLPSREVLLSQLLGMLQAPVTAFLYLLDQKSKMTPTSSATQPEQKVELTQAS